MGQYTTVNGPVRGVPVTLKASGAEGTSTNGPAVPTGSEPGALYVEVNVTAASGTSPTLTVAIQGSMDGTNWFTIGTIGANGYSSTPLGTAPSNFTTTAGPIRAIFHAPMYVRYSSTIGGTGSPSFTYSVTGTVGL